MFTIITLLHSPAFTGQMYHTHETTVHTQSTPTRWPPTKAHTHTHTYTYQY